MGDRSERQIEQEKDKTRRETLGRYFFDLSKVTFVGLVIGGAVTLFAKNEVDEYYVFYLVLAGSVLTYLFAWIGNRILKQ
jgi:hypothetical protein